MVYASRPHASFFSRLLYFACQSGKKPGNWKAVSHISPGVTFYFFTTSAASPTSASASFHQSEAAFKIWLLTVCAFYQRVLAAVWLAARLLPLYMNEGRAHLSYQSVNVTASTQKASVSRLKTALCSLRGQTLSLCPQNRPCRHTLWLSACLPLRTGGHSVPEYKPSSVYEGRHLHVFPDWTAAPPTKYLTLRNGLAVTLTIVAPYY